MALALSGRLRRRDLLPDQTLRALLRRWGSAIPPVCDLAARRSRRIGAGSGCAPAGRGGRDYARAGAVRGAPLALGGSLLLAPGDHPFRPSRRAPRPGACDPRMGNAGGFGARAAAPSARRRTPVHAGLRAPGGCFRLWIRRRGGTTGAVGGGVRRAVPPAAICQYARAGSLLGARRLPARRPASSPT